MLPTGASSRIIGGRAGGRSKISVRVPSRDVDKMLATSAVDELRQIDSSSVNAAATTAATATVAAAVPVTSAVPTFAAAAAVPATSAVPTTSSVPAAAAVPATSAVPAAGPVAWSRIRAAGKRAPKAAKRAADASKTARVPLSDQELLDQALRTGASQAPPGSQPRRSGTTSLELQLKPPRHTRPASAALSDHRTDGATHVHVPSPRPQTSLALEESAGEAARVACPHCGRTLAADRLALHAPTCEERQRPARDRRDQTAFLPRYPVESPSYLTKRALLGSSASRKVTPLDAPPGSADDAAAAQRSFEALQQRRDWLQRRIDTEADPSRSAMLQRWPEHVGRTSAVLAMPQHAALAALAAWGGGLSLWAALRAREARRSHSGPHARLRWPRQSAPNPPILPHTLAHQAAGWRVLPLGRRRLGARRQLELPP
eukprot:scaffold62750_cov52-Phaeocystis_antarctica.AAC.1